MSNYLERIGQDKIEDREEIEQLTARVAELEAEVLRLRNALDSVQQVANRSDGIAGWHLNGDIASWDSILPEVEDALSSPFTPTALHELIEKVEKMTIERCAGVCKTLDRKEKRHAAGYGPGYMTHTASDCEQIIRALPTGVIKLEELL